MHPSITKGRNNQGHPEPKVPHGLSIIMSINDIENIELARQLTLIDYEPFSNIKVLYLFSFLFFLNSSLSFF